MNAGDTRESAREISTQEDLLDFIDAALTRPHFIPDGGVIQIRRADYLDTKRPEMVISGATTGRMHGHLTVFDGGRT